MQFLYQLIGDLDSIPENQSVPQYLIAQVFKAFRKSKVRRPDIFILHGPAYSKTLSTVENFAFCEQMFVSALDYGDLELAKKYLDVLVVQFPESSRVKRLQGMQAEASGEYDVAIMTYDAILEANPSNILVMKRKVAALKSQGKIKLAVEALHEIVKVFQSDTASWLELAEIHLSLCDYQSAAYCFEEIILVTPTSAPIYCRLAEALYTLGGAENLIKARQYYSISLVHQKAHNNNRALYGLTATCREILSPQNKKLPEGEADVTAALLAWSVDQLKLQRASNSSDISRLVADVLSTS